MSAWTAGRLPITVAPLPGEALESWIAAYARRLHTTSYGLIAHLGLGGTRINQMALRLREHEAAVFEQATGVDTQVLAEMTLEPYDGLAVAIQPGRRALAAWFPAGRFGTGRARYCPACLARDDGRGPVSWRLPWSFACTVHRVLLADFCPTCHRPPRMWNARRMGPQAGGACTRDNPATSARRGGCGADLTKAAIVPLPAGGLVLAAQQHLAGLMTTPAGGRRAALTALRQVYAVAWRALRGLHAVPWQAPPVVRAVLEEVGAKRPGRAGAEVGRDAHSAAIGAALACVALDPAHPNYEMLFGWVLAADRSLLAGRQSKPGIGAVAKRWAWSGPDLVSRVLGRLDGEANLHTRLRYATATARPRWPDLPAQAITRRAAMMPAMLWPGWAMRLLPVAPRNCDGRPGDAPHSASCGAFRRGCASFLLLTGGPPQLNFERAAPLLGNRACYTDRGAVERIIYRGRDLTPLASVLAQLARALDENGAPIDYARRRALFTDLKSVTLDLDAYTRLRLQHGWTAGHAPREAVLRWYLLVLLTGEHPTIPGTKKPFSWRCGNFRSAAPRPLHAFLRRQAEASLARHGITEPVTWEPPPHWVTWAGWPGTDPARVPEDQVTALLETGGSAVGIAAATGLTAEHVRLWCEITGTGAPATIANGAVSQSRSDILAPARLRELYEYQNVPMTEIGAMAGCGTAVIRRLLELDGVPQRPSYRRPPPESGITREWLEHEYVVKLRSINALARERGVTAYYLISLARNWDLPVRRHSQFSGIGHLDLPAPPSPAMRAVTMRKGALRRLELITQIPGYASIAAAARAIYDGRESALVQRVHKIEIAAGFTIIDRSATPLVPTSAGREFLHEALQILQIARDTEARYAKW